MYSEDDCEIIIIIRVRHGLVPRPYFDIKVSGTKNIGPGIDGQDLCAHALAIHQNRVLLSI